MLKLLEAKWKSGESVTITLKDGAILVGELLHNLYPPDWQCRPDRPRYIMFIGEENQPVMFDAKDVKNVNNG